MFDKIIINSIKKRLLIDLDDFKENYELLLNFFYGLEILENNIFKDLVLSKI